MKRLLNISERNSKRILSIICLVLGLFVPGCLPAEQFFDAAFGQGCQFQRTNPTGRCIVTYRTRGGSQKDFEVDICQEVIPGVYFTGCLDPKPLPVDDCVEVIRVSCQ